MLDKVVIDFEFSACFMPHNNNEFTWELIFS